MSSDHQLFRSGLVLRMNNKNDIQYTMQGTHKSRYFFTPAITKIVLDVRLAAFLGIRTCQHFEYSRAGRVDRRSLHRSVHRSRRLVSRASNPCPTRVTRDQYNHIPSDAGEECLESQHDF